MRMVTRLGVFVVFAITSLPSPTIASVDSCYNAFVLAQVEAHEIKGNVFVVTRDHIAAEYGSAVVARIADLLTPLARRAFLDSLTSEWHPEELHAELVGVLFEELTRGDDVLFAEFIRRNTHLGLSRFSQAVLALPSPDAVLKQIPRLTRFVRRGPIEAEVERAGADAIVRWSRFPFFRERPYAATFIGTVRALIEPSTPFPVRVTVEERTTESLSLRVRTRPPGPSSIPPPPRV
jgi:hypothetical protein